MRVQRSIRHCSVHTYTKLLGNKNKNKNKKTIRHNLCKPGVLQRGVHPPCGQLIPRRQPNVKEHRNPCPRSPHRRKLRKQRRGRGGAVAAAQRQLSFACEVWVQAAVVLRPQRVYDHAHHNAVAAERPQLHRKLKVAQEGLWTGGGTPSGDLLEATAGNEDHQQGCDGTAQEESNCYPHFEIGKDCRGYSNKMDREDRKCQLRTGQQQKLSDLFLAFQAKCGGFI